jgi:hypothetical protein
MQAFLSTLIYDQEKATHPTPAACARLGEQWFIRAVHGHNFEGGSGPELATAANDGALMHTELVKDHG